MNRVVASMWLASAAIFGVGVLILAQSNIGGNTSGGSLLREQRQVRQVIRADRRLATGGANLAPVTPLDDEVQGPTAGAATPQTPSQSSDEDQAMQPPAPPPANALQGWVTVTGEDAIMRPRPSESSPMMFAFPVGRKLAVVQQANGWTEAVDPRSRATGWIASDQLGIPGQPVAGLANSQQNVAEDGPGDGGYAMPDMGRRGHRRHRDGPIASFFRRAFRP